MTALCQKCGHVSIRRKTETRYQCVIAIKESNRNYKREHTRAYKWDCGVLYLKRSEREALKAGKVCAICGGKEDLCIDHNHRTGEIRGVLCTHCNWLLGHAKDNPETLARAIEYLKA